MNFDQADALNEAIRAIGIRHRALCVAALAPFGIHPGHKLLLLELEAEGPRTQAELAAATGYEAPTITLSVRQLEAAGLVVRRPSPTDGRATIVRPKVGLRLEMEATVPFRDVIIYIPPGRPYFCVEPVSHIPGEIGSTRLEVGATLAGNAVIRLSNL